MEAKQEKRKRREDGDVPYIKRTERYDIQLEKDRTVFLDKREWQILQRFLLDHEDDEFNITVNDYKHLPKKVKLVIDDWLNMRQYFAKRKRIRKSQ